MKNLDKTYIKVESGFIYGLWVMGSLDHSILRQTERKRRPQKMEHWQNEFQITLYVP